MNKSTALICLSFLILAACTLTIVASGVPRVLVEWGQNSEPNIGGYKVHYGTNSRDYQVVIDAGNTTNLITSNFVRGVTYYFAATAYNTMGLESEYSEESSIFIPDEAKVTVTSILQSSSSSDGPWSSVATNPAISFPAEGCAFFRVLVGVDAGPPQEPEPGGTEPSSAPPPMPPLPVRSTFPSFWWPATSPDLLYPMLSSPTQAAN